MTQKLHPLYGEYASDASIANSVPLPGGLYAAGSPSISGPGGGSGWTVQINADADGWLLWKTRGETTNGRYVIQESAAIQENIAGPDATHPRIDLLVGIHKYVTGPTDTGGEPTGVLTTDQMATYAIIQGTPASTPVAPAIPDPYDLGGHRAVALLQIYVPTSGTPTLSYPTDYRMSTMAAIDAEVAAARSTYSSVGARLDALVQGQLVEAVRFNASNQLTTGGGAYALPTFDDTDQYGTAVTITGDNTLNLAKSGIYSLIAFLSGNGFTAGSGLSALKADLTYTPSGGSPTTIPLDLDGISPGDDETKGVTCMFYVPSTWSAVSVQIKYNTAGFVNIRGTLEFRGTPKSINALAIYTGNKTFAESSGQTYPDSVTFLLVSQNTIGKGTWSVVPGTGLQDGTTDPKAEIVNGNQLKWTWTTTPGSFPETKSVKLQLADDGGRTVQKTITVTLNAYSVGTLVDTTVDQAFDRGTYTGGGAYAVHFTATGTGGVTPYIWSLVAGVDTTLPSAAINSSTGAVTGSITGTGTWKVKIRLTDSSAGPTVVDKVINISVDGIEYDPGCVPDGTPIGMPDGSNMPSEDVVRGQKVRAYDEHTFEPVDATVEDIIIYERRQLCRITTTAGSLKGSIDHRIFMDDAPIGFWQVNFPPMSKVPEGATTMWETSPFHLEEVSVLSLEILDEYALVRHFCLSNGHIFIANGCPSHNMKPLF